MPQTPERKREYMRRYMKKRRHSPGGEYERGVSPSHVSPPLEKGSVSPFVPLNPRTMTKRQLVAYLEYVGRRGFTLVGTTKGYELVAAGTGQLVPFDAVAVIEKRIATLEARTTQQEADLARLEAMIDSMLRETAG